MINLDKIFEEISKDIQKSHASKFSFDKEESGEGYLVYNFKVGDRKFRAEFSGAMVEGPDKPAKIFGFQFSDVTDDPVVGEQGITGKGNVREVFSTAVEIMKDFLKKKPGAVVFFSGDEGSRNALYSRFAKSIEKIIPGYDSYQKNSWGNIYLFPKPKKEEVLEFLKSKKLI